MLANLLAVLSLTALAAAAPGLSVSLSGPTTVKGVSNLHVAATVTNTGDEALTLLRDPRGLLHDLPTNAFSIASASGAGPKFVGAVVKYSPALAAESGAPDAVTVLAPGDAFTVAHDLSAAYSFASEGEYTISPSTLFFYVDPATGSPVELRASVGATHVARLTGSLAAPAPPLAKRQTYVGCIASMEVAITNALAVAQEYASESLAYLTANTTATPRFTTWFGALTASRHALALAHFSAIAGRDFATFTYDCTCTIAGTYAYVFPDQLGYYHLCDAFWAAPDAGTDSRGGTLIHESSHFTANGGTLDYVYGQTDAAALAVSNPGEAVMNADNHEYFAENNPALA
ncbi:peptidyl-Lys metalloendopeptidase [Epithele typhae]|uniref:peptidyl-Lys metalloendopeptidase n=1 Tax=Epithele typhae TaxID=378194 RepID=UPI002008D6F8|nr:peptidyl-Lys metalloendopeptidase [Epithele typhae]KAH9928459.1 peptidyl-Lys metalloendopeptidase [Epithele typhae]